MFTWINSIRSIVTLFIAGTFCYLCVVGKVDPKDVISVVMLVFGYYFMTKDRSPQTPN